MIHGLKAVASTVASLREALCASMGLVVASAREALRIDR
jgi:hypothetical protein